MKDNDTFPSKFCFKVLKVHSFRAFKPEFFIHFNLTFLFSYP